MRVIPGRSRYRENSISIIIADGTRIRQRALRLRGGFAISILFKHLTNVQLFRRAYPGVLPGLRLPRGHPCKARPLVVEMRHYNQSRQMTALKRLEKPSVVFD